MAVLGSAGGQDGLAGPGGHLQEVLQAQCDSEVAGPGERAVSSQCLPSASSKISEASEEMSWKWRYGGGKKYLALFSLFTAILGLLPEISSAASPGWLQGGRSAEHLLSQDVVGMG